MFFWNFRGLKVENPTFLGKSFRVLQQLSKKRKKSQNIAFQNAEDTKKNLTLLITKGIKTLKTSKSKRHFQVVSIN